MKGEKATSTRLTSRGDRKQKQGQGQKGQNDKIKRGHRGRKNGPDKDSRKRQEGEAAPRDRSAGGERTGTSGEEGEQHRTGSSEAELEGGAESGDDWQRN